MEQPELRLRDTSASHTHPAPSLAQVSPVLRGHYAGSRDGVDNNLVLLLHGLGDTAAPFAQLGTSLNPPQTAVLSLQGPERVPLLEEDAYQWWDSFDTLGELIVNPNPAATLHLLTALLEHLTAPISPSQPSSGSKTAPATTPGCGWHPSQIHLFGYAQGGSCAGELALAWARAHPVPSPSDRSPSSDPSGTGASPSHAHGHLGSLIAISAPLLSHPTPSPAARARTKALVCYRPQEERAVGLPSWRRGFETLQEIKLGRGEGMLRGMDEWRGVMRFWSEVLSRKSALELSGEVYEVTSGAPSMGAAVSR